MSTDVRREPAGEAVGVCGAPGIGERVRSAARAATTASTTTTTNTTTTTATATATTAASCSAHPWSKGDDLFVASLGTHPAKSTRQCSGVETVFVAHHGDALPPRSRVGHVQYLLGERVPVAADEARADANVPIWNQGIGAVK